jgi:hypothetical protein
VDIGVTKGASKLPSPSPTKPTSIEQNPTDALTFGKEFHLEEFKALRSEIESATATIVRLTQYMLLISAVAYAVAFGISEKVGQKVLPHQPAVLLLFFPLLCSLIGGYVCVGTAFAIKRIGAYISKLEGRIAWEGLGWERHNKTSRWAIGITTLIPWLAICAVNVLIPLFWWWGVFPLPSQ